MRAMYALTNVKSITTQLVKVALKHAVHVPKNVKKL